MRTTKGRAGWLVAAALAVALGAPALALANDRTASLEPEQIRLVQRALQDRGQQVQPTGAWDDQTRSALASFQYGSGLPATGRLDDATSRALGVDPSMVSPVGGRMAAGEGMSDPAVNCAINSTVDCLPGP